MIGEKIEMAKRAQNSWKASSFADRKRVLRSLQKWLVDNKESCAKVACRDTGKTSMYKISYLIQMHAYSYKVVDAALGEIL